MTQINQNFDKYMFSTPQTQFRAGNSIGAQREVQLPDMYYNPNDQYEETSFKEKVKKADMLNIVYPWLAHPLLMLGTCLGLSYGVDKFSKACGGEYEKSLLGKAARFGDNIQNSKLVQSKTGQGFLNGIENFFKNTRNFLYKSDVIKAIGTTPSKPQCSMVTDELLTQKQRLVHEFTRITGTLKLTEEAVEPGLMGFGTKTHKTSGFVEPSKLGIQKDEHEFLKKFFSGKEQAEEKISNAIQLKRLGLADNEIRSIIEKSDATNIVKSKTLEAFGLDKETLRKITMSKDLTPDEVKIVEKALANAKNKDIKIGAGEFKILGKFQPVRRSINCKELYNRYHSMSEGAKTATGRFMSKFLQKLHRGFTFGGGKLGVLMFVAPHIVETMVDTKKAEPNQKIGTAVQGLTSAVSWVFTFPLAIELMHAVGGMQYAGMSKDKIEEVRKIKKDFNSTVFENNEKYNEALKKAKKKVADLERVKNESLFTKFCRKVGKFLTIDLERFKSFRNGSPVGNTLRKTGGFFKNITGVPLRLVMWGGICMGILEPLISKGVKSIFGNYYDRTKEEEHEALKKQQKEFTKADLQQRLLDAQRNKVLGLNNPALNQEISTTQTPQEVIENTQAQQQNPNPLETKQQTLEQTSTETKPQNINSNPQLHQKTNPAIDIKNQADKNNYIPDQTAGSSVLANSTIKKDTQKLDNYTYIPSSENVLTKQEDNKPQNKYIPSQLAANISKTFDNSGLDNALRRAERAEKKALQTLAGNFGSNYSN